MLAMGRSEAEANGSLRITIGEQTTEAEIDALLAVLPAAVESARKAN